MRANVYIDGFNLYYGLLKDTPYRWLNISTFSRLLLPQYDVQRIKYFTARVRSHPADADAPARQQAYLRALATLADVDIFYGSFSYNKVRMQRADGMGTVEVLKAEEKGSDVALAVQALNDAHRNEYDVAVLVSNDTDIVPSLKIIRRELSKKVHILFPTCRRSRRYPSQGLKDECDSCCTQIRQWALAQSQFDAVLKDSVGQIHKPLTW